MERRQRQAIKISLSSSHSCSFPLSAWMEEMHLKAGDRMLKTKGTESRAICHHRNPFVKFALRPVSALLRDLFQSSTAHCCGLNEQGPHDLTCWAFRPQLLLLCEGCRILRPGAALEEGP